MIVGILLLLTLLLANALVTRRRLAMQVENNGRVTHTQQVLYELARLETLIRQSETGQRGFLYTGNPKYLAPYEASATKVQPQIDRIAQLTSDNPSQRERIARLRTLADKKMAELGQTIALYKEGRTQEARAEVLSGVGFDHMMAIDEVIDSMNRDEANLVLAHVDAYKRSVRATIESIYLASLLAAVGLILLAFYVFRVVNLRELHASQVAEREEWFRSTLTSLGDAVISTDGHGRITFLNPIAEKLIGTPRDLAHGKPISDVFKIFNEATLKPVPNPIAKVLEVGAVVGLANHTVLEGPDGAFIPIEDSAAPIRDSNNQIVGVVMVFRDATNERRAQAMLRKTEKLATAARLAATVAHEINNPLEAVANLIYLSKSVDGLPTQVGEYMTMAEAEIERISLITRQTLGFYRESRNPGEIHMEQLIESVLTIHSNKFKNKEITITRNYGTCPPITGLEGELKQVVANLLSNAADAVSTGGEVSVSLSCVTLPSGTVIQFDIEDDGPGIPPSVRERLFEPFFTTKKDVGNGLGLWVSKEIVDRHGGTIEVQSRTEEPGTIFQVLLPLAPDLDDTSAS